ncbi:Polarized growth chromatin-associated controller 1 [Ceratocystis platani]|uniref:Polarized growth chromatin-associated controller 1 n=1 Tax=Ceratocystis fimbriata f. sp. platani TaxID=88771 RepID=A0A0F8CX11_CERFI|nr:Polarized growth chromatin-associated controller 1 [Ceratocystis platani]
MNSPMSPSSQRLRNTLPIQPVLFAFTYTQSIHTHDHQLQANPIYPFLSSLRFPASRSLSIPFPTPRLADVALRAISVDPELSPLVNRQMSTQNAVLKVDYRATTNRMLRVATNSFMASLALVIEVMEKMDEDVLDQTASAA